MTVFLACFCSARDERPTITVEPVACWRCGDPMHPYQPPARPFDRSQPPPAKGTTRAH